MSRQDLLGDPFCPSQASEPGALRLQSPGPGSVPAGPLTQRWCHPGQGIRGQTLEPWALTLALTLHFAEWVLLVDCTVFIAIYLVAAIRVESTL